MPLFKKLMVRLLLLVNVIAIALSSSDNSFYWLETGPDPKGWIADNPLCGGLQQSPIDIRDEHVVINPRLGEIFFTGYDEVRVEPLTLLNSGKNAKITGFDPPVSIVGGGLLASRYELAEIHFHWGSNSTTGAEHTVNGRIFPLEMHLVHFSKNYDTFANSVDRPQGLAVLGVLFEITTESNPTYDPIIGLLSNIIHAGDNVTLPPISIRSLLPQNVDSFWRYRGSLTTPPCYESVMWTVFKEQIKLSESQFEAFRGLRTTENGVELSISDNFRPTQPINTRIIEECDPGALPETQVTPVAAETRQTVKTPQAVETTQAVGTTQAVETPQPVETPQAVETTQAVGTTQAVEKTQAVETPQAVETTHAVETPQAVETIQAVDTTQAVETPQVPNTPQAPKIPPAPKTPPAEEKTQVDRVVKIARPRNPVQKYEYYPVPIYSGGQQVPSKNAIPAYHSVSRKIIRPSNPVRYVVRKNYVPNRGRPYNLIRHNVPNNNHVRHSKYRRFYKVKQ